MPRDRVVRRRDLAVLDPDGEDDVDFLERLLGRARPLLAVTPADGQRVRVGDAPLAADRRRHRRLEHLGDGRQRGPGVDAAHPRVDPDPAAAGRRAGRRLAIGRLVERGGVGAEGPGSS